MFKLCALISILYIVDYTTAADDEGGVLTMNTIDHFSCPKTADWNEKMRFPSNDQTKIVADPNHPGCYKIGGDVRMFDKSLTGGKLWMYIEMSHKGSNEEAKKKMEKCYEYDEKSQCGGFGGSCMHCDFCDDSARDATTTERASKVWMTFAGRKIGCNEGFRRALQNARRAEKTGSGARNRGLALHFCLPDQNQFLKTNGIARDLWDKLVEDKNERKGKGSVPSKIAMYMTIRMFEHDFTSALGQQRLLMKLHESQTVSKKAMPMSMQKQLPFNKLIWDKQLFIGCHKIIGELQLN